jgi:hypothetical protein
VWGIRHTMRNVSEDALQALDSLIDRVSELRSTSPDINQLVQGFFQVRGEGACERRFCCVRICVSASVFESMHLSECSIC